MAAELGFEPRQTESESVVLPLHNSAIYKNNKIYYTSYITICQWFFGKSTNLFIFAEQLDHTADDQKNTEWFPEERGIEEIHGNASGYRANGARGRDNGGGFIIYLISSQMKNQRDDTCHNEKWEIYALGV